MGEGPAPRAGVRMVERYQRSAHRKRVGSHCRFTPTCSHYAHEAFSTRPFLVALGLTASRVLRCNPMVRRFTHDPVRRAERVGPRANTVRSLALVSVLGGLMMVFLAGGSSYADPIQGDACTGGANNRSAASMTSSNPLELRRHDVLRSGGTADFAGDSDKTTVDVEIVGVEGLFGITKENDGGTGKDWSSDKVKVDDYFKLGLGKYRFEVRVSSESGECTFVGYVKLVGGNPLTKPVGATGAGVTVVGGVTAMFSKRPRSPRSKRRKKDMFDRAFKASDKAEAAAAAPEATPDDYSYDKEDGLLGCFFMTLALPLAVMPLFGAGGGGGVPGGAPPRWSKVIRRHGYPIRGFVGGLLFGLGLVVVLWQYAVWTLAVWNVIGLPVVLGVLVGIWAWMGVRFRATLPAHPAPPAQMAPPPPPAPAASS